MFNIKNIIRNYLFKDIIEKINAHEEIIGNASKTLEKSILASDFAKAKLKEAIKEYDDARDLVSSIVDCAVDIHESRVGDRSWAVVCIHGKMNYVNFLDLGHRDAKSIMGFLKQFKRSNLIIDSISPYFCNEVMKDAD